MLSFLVDEEEFCLSKELSLRMKKREPLFPEVSNCAEYAEHEMCWVTGSGGPQGSLVGDQLWAWSQWGCEVVAKLRSYWSQHWSTFIHGVLDSLQSYFLSNDE